MSTNNVKLFACFLADLLANGEKEEWDNVSQELKRGGLVSYLTNKYPGTLWNAVPQGFYDLERELGKFDETIAEGNYPVSAEENALCGLLCMVIDQLL